VDILNDTMIPDDIKSHMYSSILNSINAKLTKLTEEVPKQQNIESSKASTAKTENKKTVEEIPEKDLLLLQGLPDSIRWKGSYILSVLKQYPKLIYWDKVGRVSFFSEIPGAGSNIIDLLRYVLSPVKAKTLPQGINRFLFVLKHINVPSAVLSQSLRNEFMSKPVPRVRGNRESSASVSGLFKNLTGNLFNWESYDNSDRIEEEDET
jgi:hypothetical protein